MKATKTTTTQEQVTGSSFPSADLINFRFDQSDKFAAKLDAKLDRVLEQAVSQKDMAEAKVESVAQHLELQKQIDSIRVAAKWWVGVLLTVTTVAVGVVALIIK